MSDPIINGRLGNMKQGTDFCYLIERFRGQARSFEICRSRLLLVNTLNLFADYLANGLPELFWLVGKQYRGNDVTSTHVFFHHFSF